jgi:hypothetical protein
VPKSSGEFERKCKELRGRTDELVRYVRLVDPNKYKTIFKTLSKETLEYVAAALPHIVKTDHVFAVTAMTQFMLVDRFELVVPMLSKSAKENLRAVVGAVQAQGWVPAARHANLNELRQIYRL